VTFVSSIVQQLPEISKPRRSFLIDLLAAFQTCPGRATMLNLARFGAGSPRRIARWFSRPFDWPGLNLLALKDQGVLENDLVVCIDATFLPKSGKKTWGLANFYDGVDSRVERGCEAVSVGLLDLDEATAYSLHIRQTPARFDLPDFTRVDFQLQTFLSQEHVLKTHGLTCVVGDGFYAKAKVIDGLNREGFDLVTKLRRDASMRYLYAGPRTGNKGRPKTYDGKVDWGDLSRFEDAPSPRDGVALKWATVHSSCFGRVVKVVAEFRDGSSRPNRLLMSTDLEMETGRLWMIYTQRFQHEYVFRDGKQFMGLADGQMRDRIKREEHLGASLSALNLFRLGERAKLERDERATQVISMASWKRRAGAEYVAQRIIEYFDPGAECDKILAAISSTAWFRRIAS